MTDHKGKSWMRERLIGALLVAPTIKEAAARAGISERTALRWLSQPELAQAYAQANGRLLEQATAKLRAESGAAVDVLASVAGDAEAAPGARATAARSILELALKAHEAENLEARIAELEGRTHETH